jgi:hypothetical protein
MENKVALQTEVYVSMCDQLAQQDAEIQSHIKVPLNRHMRIFVTNINLESSSIIVILFKVSLRARHKLAAHGIKTTGLIIIHF